MPSRYDQIKIYKTDRKIAIFFFSPQAFFQVFPVRTIFLLQDEKSARDVNKSGWLRETKE